MRTGIECSLHVVAANRCHSDVHGGRGLVATDCVVWRSAALRAAQRMS
jgi:hypothetical protein